MPQPEITTRIRREALLELLETEAPVQEQRITARMPVVRLTDLLGAGHEPPRLDADAIEPPTLPRTHVRANGTEQALKALSNDPSVAIAMTTSLESLMGADAPAVIVDRAPVELAPEPAAPRRRRAKQRGEAFDMPPLNPGEIASVLQRIDELRDAPLAVAEAVASAAPPAPSVPDSVVAASPVPPTPHTPPLPQPLAPSIALAAAVPSLQLTSLAMPLTRGLVIALSASATLLLAHLARLL